MKSYVLSAFALGMFVAGTASAEVEIRTFESKVVSVPPPPSSTTTTYQYKVYGPDKIEYTLEGPPSEITRLAETVRVNPNAMVHFEGDVVEGPNRVFRMKKWESSTQTDTDMFGKRTTTTTSQTTENR